MQADSKRQMENQLLVMGLRRLTDPELIPQLGSLVKDHQFFLGLLNECEQEKRTEMYEALRPHLKFTPWPLDTYMACLKANASAAESRANPIKIGDERFQEVPLDDATGCVIKFTCHKCTRTEMFHGGTPVGTALAARQAGWVRDPLKQKEICPKCPAVREGKYQKLDA